MRGARERLSKILGSRGVIAWALAAGFIVRVAWAIAAGDAPRFYDSDSYITIARNLFAGDGFLWGNQYAGRPPLYPILVAGLRFKLFGREFLALYLAQAVLGTASIYLFAAAARRLIGKTAAGVTALVLALDPFLVFYCGAVLSETLFIFFLAALFYQVAGLLEKPRFQGAVYAGLATGAAFLTRPSAPGIFAVFIIAVIIWARPRKTAVMLVAAMAVVAALVVLPWGIRNKKVTGHWVFTTLGVGASLYDGVGPQADGSSDMNFLHSMPELAQMDEYARDRYLSDRAIDAVVDDPGHAARLALVKAWRFWSPVPNSSDFRSTLYVVVSLLAVTPVYVFAILAILSRALGLRQFFILIGPPVYMTLVHMVFVGSTRYRAPVMPFVVMTAAAYAALLLSGGAKAEPQPATEGAGRAMQRRGRRLTLPFRIFLALVVVVGLAAAGGYTYYTRWLADPANVEALAVRTLELLFPGKNVSISTAEFGLLSGLDLHNVEIRERGAAGASVARLGYAHVDFALKRLLRLGPVPKSVTVSDLYLDLVRSKEGGWNLAVPVSPGASGRQDAVAPGFSVSLRAAFVSVDDRFSDYSVSLSAESLTAAKDISDPAAWHVWARFGGPLLGKWMVNAEARPSEKRFFAQFGAAGLDLGKGFENRLPPAARNVYNLFNPTGPADVTGTVGYDPAAGWDFDVKAVLAGCGIVYKRLPVAVSDVSGQVNFTRRGVTFRDITGSAIGGQLQISGDVAEYARAGGYRVRFSVADARAGEELMQALPENVRRVAGKFDARGAFDATGTIERALGDGTPLEVTMDVYPKGMAASFKDFPYPLSDIRGHFSYGDGKVLIEKISGRRDKAEFLLEGQATGLGRAPRIDIEVSGRNVPLDDTVRGLLPERVKAAWESLALSGAADIDARVSKHGAEALDCALDVRLKDASILYERFPYRLASGEARLRVENEMVTVESARFWHGGGELSLEGEVNADTGELDFNLSGKKVGIDREFLDALPEAAAKTIRSMGLSGRGSATMTISRDADGKMSFGDIAGRLEDAACAAGAIPMGVGARRVDFVYSRDALEVNGLEGFLFSDSALAVMPALRLAVLARPATQVALTGNVGLGEKRGPWQVRFEAKRLFIGSEFISNMPEGVRSLLEERLVHGLVDAEGTLAYLWEGGGGLRYDLGLSCTDAGFVLKWPVAHINGEIGLKGASSGRVNTFGAKGKLDSLSFAGREMGKTEFDLTRTENEARLDSLETQMLGGTLVAQGRIDLGGTGGYALTAKVRGMSLKEIVDKAFGFHKEGLGGIVDGRVSLLSLTGKASDLVGSAEANVTEGTLWEVPMVLAMMNVLNLKFPERTQFDRAHVVLEVVGSKLRVKELSMSSAPATLVGEGTIGFDGAIDLIFYSRPGQIPIVSILAGQVGRNIVKARIHGTFLHPSVMLVPSGPFGKLVDWLRSAGGKGE